ncbi:MAG: GNAT family N-acetyltransferase, partial [Silanimonas sp.]
ASCALHRLSGRCPNCGGGLQMRPLRVGEALARHPASTRRVVATGATPSVMSSAAARTSRQLGEVRALRPEDRAEWEALWQGYLVFYGTALAPETTGATWRRLLDPASPMFARVAIDVDGRLLGFAHALPHEGTWTTALQCYLEDLFVAPEARGAGAGRALIDDLVALCRTRGWSRLYWHTQAGNAGARRIYDDYARADDMLRYRLVL